MPKIIVLGAGIGGISMAYELRSANRPNGRDHRALRHFLLPLCPVKPLGGADWRRPEDIKVPLQEH